jgi:hypothetical protein
LTVPIRTERIQIAGKLISIVLLIACLGCTVVSRFSINPRVTTRVEFTSSTLTGPVHKTQLATWWNTKLKIGSEDPDAYEFLTLSTNGQQTRIRVETCAEYTNAILQGSYSLTTADMAMERWFVRAVGTLRFIESAKPSTHVLSDDFLTQLPVSVLGWSGSDEEAQINADTRKGMTLNDHARSGRVTKLKAQEHSLSFQTLPKDFAVEELARGDSNGDGFEDALIFVAWHYREGSGFGYELYVLSSQRTNNSKLHVRSFPLR